MLVTLRRKKHKRKEMLNSPRAKDGRGKKSSSDSNRLASLFLVFLLAGDLIELCMHVMESSACIQQCNSKPVLHDIKTSTEKGWPWITSTIHKQINILDSTTDIRKERALRLQSCKGSLRVDLTAKKVSLFPPTNLNTPFTPARLFATSFGIERTNHATPDAQEFTRVYICFLDILCFRRGAHIPYARTKIFV